LLVPVAGALVVEPLPLVPVVVVVVLELLQAARARTTKQAASDFMGTSR
jgi:hypothetical protein